MTDQEWDEAKAINKLVPGLAHMAVAGDVYAMYMFSQAQMLIQWAGVACCNLPKEK